MAMSSIPASQDDGSGDTGLSGPTPPSPTPSPHTPLPLGWLNKIRPVIVSAHQLPRPPPLPPILIGFPVGP